MSNSPITEPRVGAVYVYLGTADGDEPSRYIILDALREDFCWLLDLVNIETQSIIRHFSFDLTPETYVRFEPLADGEEVLFFQAMIAPHTLEGASE
jgi:hypothetical protein